MTADWRAVETAPKDGTEVLLNFPDGCPSTRVGRYVIKGVVRSDCWFSYAGVLRERREITPSHWMPLPEPPK